MKKSDRQSKTIEFSVGDSKSNQQTASKVDCSIIINNHNRKESKSDDSSLCEIVENVEESKSPSQNTQPETHASRNISSNINKTSGLQINVPLAQSRLVEQQHYANRYLVTSRVASILREEILQSHEVKNKLLEIFQTMLINNNKQLLANILDQSNHIILDGNSLAELIITILNLGGENAFETSDVKITYNENVLSSCFKIQISPFKRILKIMVGDQDLELHQHEVYTTIINDFKISLDTVYCK